MDGLVVIEGIHLQAVRPPQIFQADFVDEDLVTQRVDRAPEIGTVHKLSRRQRIHRSPQMSP